MPPTGGEVRGTAAAVYPGRRRCRRPQGLASKLVKSAIFLFILACSPPGTTDASPVKDSEEPAVQPSLPLETAIQEPLLGRPADEEQQQPQSTTERESFPPFTETIPEEVDTNKIDMGVDIEIDPNGQPSIDEELHQYFLQLRQEMQELSGANVELPVVEPESSPANDDIAETTTTEEEEADFVDDPVTRVIFSCNELHSGRTAVLGTVILAGDIICAKERVIEVVDGGEARLLSDAPMLRIEGVRFVVGEDSAMYFGVNAMAVGALKGGSARQMFTVLSGGHLAFHAEKQGPLPEGGHEEDSHSIVRVHEGSLFDVIGYAEYTASSVTVTSKKYSKNPEWMRVYRTRKKLERQHREEQQQQQQRSATTVMPWVYRPFSSKESRTSTFTQRQQQSPERLEVGDELRYPATMTSLFGGSKLALGLDGSLLIAPGARVREIDAKVDEASYVTAEHVANGLGVFARKKLDGDLFPALLAKVDEDDTLKVKTLVAPRGDVSRALLQRKFSAMQGRDDKDSSGGATNNTAAAAAAAAAIAAQEAASARRIKALWEGLEQEKQRMLRLRGGGTPSGAEDGDASMPPPSQSPPHEHKQTVEDNTPPITIPSSAEHKETVEDSTPPPLPPMSLELDDGVVLRVTDTGSMVVTVDGITAIDLGNPHVTKRKKGTLGSRIKDFFGGLRRRRGSNDDDKRNGVNDDGGAIVSEGYTLHAVENGFEVRLEGIFVWGRVL